MPLIYYKHRTADNHLSRSTLSTSIINEPEWTPLADLYENLVVFRLTRAGCSFLGDHADSDCLHHHKTVEKVT